jgi:hypothetical protein
VRFAGSGGDDDVRDVPATILVACDGASVVTAIAFGMTPERVDAIVETFEFRDPPGDPNRPPAASPSG